MINSIIVVNGLARDNIVNDGITTNIAPVHYEFKNEYVFKTTINRARYLKLLTDLAHTNGVTYFED